MSKKTQEQEIDLGSLFKKASGLYKKTTNRFFNAVFFVRRNIIALAVLFLLGGAIGAFLDKTGKVYDHEIIVSANFNSVEYLYSKIALLEAKKKENDTLFFNNLGIKNVKNIRKISVKPLLDIFQFVNLEEKNFELIELMAEDGSFDKIVKDEQTAKSYPVHLVSFSTTRSLDQKEMATPLLKYLNDTEYYSVLQKQHFANNTAKIAINDTIIKQIDQLLDQVSSGSKNKSSVYVNNGSQLAEMLKSKNDLIKEQAHLRVYLINKDKVIKELSITGNIQNTKGLNNKLKFVLPMLFIFLYSTGGIFINVYRKQAKRRAEK